MISKGIRHGAKTNVAVLSDTINVIRMKTLQDDIAH